MRNDALQQQYETVLANTDVYGAAIYETIMRGIEGQHLSPEAALKTLFAVAGRISNDLLGGVDAFEHWALDYIEFARNADKGRTYDA